MLTAIIGRSVAVPISAYAPRNRSSISDCDTAYIRFVFEHIASFIISYLFSFAILYATVRIISGYRPHIYFCLDSNIDTILLLVTIITSVLGDADPLVTVFLSFHGRSPTMRLMLLRKITIRAINEYVVWYFHVLIPLNRLQWSAMLSAMRLT